MTTEAQFRAIIDAQNTLIAALEAALAEGRPSPPSVPPPPMPVYAPPPPPQVTVGIVAAPVPPAVQYIGDHNGMRVDLPAAPGTPGTVILPVTGHVVSLPMDEQGELGMGYLNRVHRQVGDLKDEHVGSIASMVILGWSAAAQTLGVLHKAPKEQYPIVADYLLNTEAYITASMTAEQRAAHAAQQAANQRDWEEATRRMAAGAAPTPPAEAEFPIGKVD